MKKILFIIISLLCSISVSHAWYSVVAQPMIWDINISEWPYTSLISPLQWSPSGYRFGSPLNPVKLCDQIYVSKAPMNMFLWMVECKKTWDFSETFPITSFPFYIYDERELISPPAWTGVLPPSTAPTMVGMVGNTASGSITAAGDIMATPFWSIVYFIIGIALLSVAIGVIFWISRKG